MGRRRDTLLLVALVVIVVAMALAVGKHEPRDDGIVPRPSTYISSKLGSRALYEVLRELDVPVGRRMTAYDAGDDSLRDALVVLAPSLPASPGEAHALAGWVRRGGTLVYVVRRGDGVSDTLGLRLRTFAADSIFAEAQMTGVTATAGPGLVGEGVGTVDGFRRGFAASSRPLAGATVVASSRGVPVVIDYRLGKGRVIAWSDPYPLLNARLRTSRAAILFARTATEASGGRKLWFDEYHHGFQAGGSAAATLGRFLARDPWGHAVLQLAAAAVLLLLLLGRRFGAPLAPAPARRRSPLEHVEALAGAYRQARAHETARRLVLAGLARRLGRRVPPSVKDEGEMIRRLAAHPTAGAAARALETEWKKGRAADLVALSNDVDRYLDEVNRT